MKRLIISLVLLAVFFGFAAILVGAEGKNSEPATGEVQPRGQVEKPTGKGTAGAGVIADTNAVAEPNAAKVKPKWFEEISGLLESVDKESRGEIREWLRGRIEDRMSLAEAVQKQIVVELNMVRGLAVEEGAVKTTEAIDRLLAKRTERFEQVMKRMREAREKMRLGEREERGERGRTRTPRSRERGNDLDQKRPERERRTRDRSDRTKEGRSSGKSTRTREADTDEDS